MSKPANAANPLVNSTTESSPRLDRETFTTTRLLEYFSEKELALQTGHARDAWGEVIVKELTDNALDACEDANAAPSIQVAVSEDSITVTDNGPGIPPLYGAISELFP